MKFTTSLNKNYEFRRLYNRGKSAGSSYIVIYCRRNGTKSNRLGITVSKKIGWAVLRNLVRRRLKEIYRLNEVKLNHGYDIVIVARVKIRTAQYKEIDASAKQLLKKLGLLVHTPT